jgi:formylglycine-generating enzyme required for sulfatase activity
MGAAAGPPEESPVHDVAVPDFEMMRTEVTKGQYQACVDAGACPAPSCAPGDLPDQPVTCISWREATQFSAWVGARLPSESEWEFAAKSRGQDNAYPWGNEGPDETRANYNRQPSAITSVCSFPAGNTEQGLCDMAGNVHEWVEDAYRSDYVGAPNDGSAWAAPGPGLHSRAYRGGSSYDIPRFLRTTARIGDPRVDGAYDTIGFRLARSP